MNKVALSTVASVSAGQSAPKQNEFSNTGIPFVRAGSLEDLLSGRNESDLELVSEETAKKYNLKLYPKGSILFAKSGMSATKDRIYVLKNPAYVVSHLAILIPNDKIHTDYLRLALKKFPPSILIKDLAYPAISLGEIQAYQIPVPDNFDAQKRIAYLLSKVERLISQRKESLQYLDDFLKSTFLEMFGEPVRNEKRWEKKPFSKLLAGIESGKSPKCEIRVATEEEWGVLKLGAVTSCYFKENENKALPQNIKPQTKDEVKRGDLLFSRKNTYELVAACAYVFKTRPKLLMPDLIFRFVFKEEAEVNPIFIWKLLTATSQRKKIQSLAGGAAGSMPNISKSNLSQVLLPIPPIDLQNQFAAIVEKGEEIKARYQESLTELKYLYGSLSQLAFKGELDMSRITLPTENTEVAEEEKSEKEDKQRIVKIIELPAPADLAAFKSSDGRKTLIGVWLTAWFEQLGDTPFKAQTFMDATRQRLLELMEDDMPGWGAAEYDELKDWVFKALGQGRLMQSYNDANNSVQITAKKG